MKRHALFAGVNTYDDPAIRPLRFSIPDASVLADRFGRLGFSTRLLPDPTAAELLSARLIRGFRLLLPAPLLRQVPSLA